MGERELVLIHVVPFGLMRSWDIRVNSRKIVTVRRKEDAEDLAVFLGKLMSPASVRVHNRDGTIAEESTFDSSADPPESPG